MPNFTRKPKPSTKIQRSKTTGGNSQQSSNPIQNLSKQTLTPDTIMQLQREHGNQFTQQVLQRVGLRDMLGNMGGGVEMDNEGKPKLKPYYDKAKNEIWLVTTQIINRWKRTLDKDNPYSSATPKQIWNTGGRGQVREFSKGEFTIENINFLDEVEEYKTFPTEEKAHAIFNKYIDNNADQSVNLSYGTRQALINSIELVQSDLITRSDDFDPIDG